MRSYPPRVFSVRSYWKPDGSHMRATLEYAAREAWGYAAFVVDDESGQMFIVKAPSQARSPQSTFKFIVGAEHGPYADAQWAEYQKERK
jgi:hypothetical protein